VIESENMTVEDIISLLKSPSKQDIDLVKRAYSFAEKAHEGQKRYSGEPYFSHLAQTARYLAEIGMGSVTISAGLLHDVVEDTPVTKEELEEEFGKEISFLVEGVTKLGTVRYRGSDRYNESLRKLFVATSQDIRVLIIKLADRLHNIRTIEHVPEEKRKRIATETLEIYAPVAYRLGIRRLSRELENGAFPYVYPDEYKEMQALTKERHYRDISILDKFRKSLKKLLGSKSIKLIRTEYRVKSLYSLYKKWIEKNKDMEKIYDYLALRVMVPTVEDCYKALGLIHNKWRPLPGRIKDYIAFPKPNGYQSLHTTVLTGDGGVVEIQIKTEEMYRESEFGIAAHISYKTRNSKMSTIEWIRSLLPTSSLTTEEQKVSDVPNWIKDMVKYQDEGDKGDGKLPEMKTDFLKERIFTFTPQGDVIDLPIDSTVIDFAYSVHSNIGDKAHGAYVNGKFVSLDTKLENGDIVKIETTPKGKPTQKWLDFAKTATAQRHIRSTLKQLKQ